MDSTNQTQSDIADKPRQAFSPIPPSIVKAISAVKATMETVKKSQKNVHGNYMYASIDDIYESVTKKMGEVGLILLALEDGEPTIQRIDNKDGKSAQWMKISYVFVFATEEATWTHPEARRTMWIQILGPQTFQAAQSYMEKTFLKSAFQIPTGDGEVDSLPEGFEYNPIALGARPERAKELTPPPVPPESLKKVQATVNYSAPIIRIPLDVEIKASLETAQTIEAMDEIWGENIAGMSELPRDVRAGLDDAYEANAKRLRR